MRWRAQKVDEFEVSDVSERLTPYAFSRSDTLSDSVVDDDLAERAITLLRVMPRNQQRETVESLLCPNDPQRGRRVIDGLIDAALATEDDKGRLRRLA
jgi:hypothetical protein